MEIVYGVVGFLLVVIAVLCIGFKKEQLRNQRLQDSLKYARAELKALRTTYEETKRDLDALINNAKLKVNL